MAVKIKKEYIGYYQVGSVIEIPIDFVENLGATTATEVQVTLIYPAGLTYNSDALDQGSYNDTTKVWTINTLLSGQKVGGLFYFNVVDDCSGPYSITFTASTLTGCESCLADNVICVVTEGVSCCELSGCGNEHIQTITTATHTALLTEKVFLADATSNAVDFTLPSPSAAYNSSTLKGHEFTFKVIEFSNGVSVTTPSGKLVDNTTIAAAGTVYNFGGVGDSITVVSDGTNYYIV